MTAGYSGTPLPRKLGIKPGHRVLVAGAPRGFALADVPVDEQVDGDEYDVALLFCADQAALAAGWSRVAPAMSRAGALWVAWPKRASGVATDLTEDVVRAFALAHGRVDVKVCAVDETWSGLKCVIRLADR
jgi:hypothetical protein